MQVIILQLFNEENTLYNNNRLGYFLFKEEIQSDRGKIIKELG